MSMRWIATTGMRLSSICCCYKLPRKKTPGNADPLATVSLVYMYHEQTSRRLLTKDNSLL